MKSVSVSGKQIGSYVRDIASIVSVLFLLVALVALSSYVNNPSKKMVSSSSAAGVHSGGDMDTSKSFSPTEDTYLNRWAPNKVYGNSSVLGVRVSHSEPVQTSLLKFDISAYDKQKISKAVLSLYVVSQSNGNPITLEVSPAEMYWNERKSTYNNTPLRVGKKVSSKVVKDKGRVDIDVTALLTSEVASNDLKTRGIAITGVSKGNVGYAVASREYWKKSARPVLSVWYKSSATSGRGKGFMQAAKFTSEGKHHFSFIKLPGYPDFNMGSKPLTIEFWLKPDRESVSRANGGYLFYKKNYRVTLERGRIGFVVLVDYKGQKYAKYVTSRQVLSPDKWHFVKVVKSGRDLYVFVDGNEATKKTIPAKYSFTEETSPPILGCFAPGGVSNRCFGGQYEGYMDDLRVSHRADLSKKVPSAPMGSVKAIVGLWHFNGNAVDSSGHWYNGGPRGDVEFVVPK